jgi:ferritin-like metal-binding protein YciE
MLRETETPMTDALVAGFETRANALPQSISFDTMASVLKDEYSKATNLCRELERATNSAGQDGRNVEHTERATASQDSELDTDSVPADLAAPALPDWPFRERAYCFPATLPVVAASDYDTLRTAAESHIAALQGQIAALSKRVEEAETRLSSALFLIPDNVLCGELRQCRDDFKAERDAAHQARERAEEDLRHIHELMDSDKMTLPLETANEETLSQWTSALMGIIATVQDYARQGERGATSSD